MRSQTRTSPWYFYLSIGAVLIIVLAIPSVRQHVWQGVTSTSRPIFNTSTNLLNRFGWNSSLHEETPSQQALREQLQAVTVQLAQTRQILEDQGVATRLNEFITTTKLRTISANVVAFSPDPGIQSFVINIGRNQHLRPGLGVITDQGILIGKIITVREATATVLLLNDPQSIVLARLQNDRQSQGAIRGQRGLTVQMDLIPKNDTIERGQTIVTSGLEDGIPPDLVIGTIASTEQRAGEVFQRARVNLPLRFVRVHVVAVVVGF